MDSRSALSLVLPLAVGLSIGWQARGRRERLKAWRRRRPQPGAPREVSDQQLRDWIEAMPQGWLAIAPDQSIASLNPRAERLLGCVRGTALLGQPITALEPSDEVLHLIQLAREKGAPQRGSWPVLSDTLNFLVLPGLDGWVGLLMQGRNPLQAQLEHQEGWVSDVAHELKTPITALMLVSDSLAERVDGHQSVLVGRLQKELRRLQQLVSDLLDLSRLENTPLAEASPGGVDPHAVLAAVWATLQPLARSREIHLRVIHGVEAPCLAAVNPARLHQALVNLLDNALRYSPDGGDIAVEIRRRERWCVISVHDQGPGLSEEDLERLFQRFYRGDPSRFKGPSTGSGLGLSIVQQIALSHGGLVRAENHPEGGAVLELLLPRAPTP